MSKSSQGVRKGFILALASLFATGAAVAQEYDNSGEPLGERESYAFVRTIDGQATVAADGQGIGNSLDQNQPLLSGDRLRTDGASRVEIILPDRNRLTLDRDSVVTLDRMAYSGDRESRITVLVLNEGELLLEVSEEALGDELPRIETGSATIYVQEPGTYRVRYERDGWLELVTRSGYAEMVTDRGSTVVRAGESAQSGSDRYGRVAVERAGGFDDLESWSDDLVRASDRVGRSSRHLDGQFEYASSQLDNHGDWVVYADNYYWRPRVSVGWSPYWDGRWGWTPSGYTWISYEPWGWVPYHYGRWSMLPGYGWAWYPGTVYSPAWVYWHWSGGYAGWCPTGYYTDYYNPWYRGGFRWGFYGWAGGSWGHYSHWNFAPVHCFRDRNFRGQFRRGDDLKRERGWPEMQRGLITTDTREFRPDRIDRADQLIHKIDADQKNRLNRELPDVTDFVGRKRDLAPPIARAIAPDNDRSPKIRFNEPKVVSTPGWREGDKAGRAGTVADGGKVASRDPGAKGGDSKDRGAVTGRDTKDWRGSTPAVSGGSKDGQRIGGSGDGKVAGGRVAQSPPNTRPDSTGKGAQPGGRVQVPENPRPDSSGKGGQPATRISDSRQGWKESPGRGGGGVSSSSGAGRPAQPKATAPDRSGGSAGSKGTGSSARQDDRSRSSAPVERVISGTRKPAPQSEGSASASKGREPHQALRTPGNGGGSSRGESSADAGRKEYRQPAQSQSVRSAPRQESSYRSAPPASDSSYRKAPTSNGSSYRNAPPASGSSYRNAPPASGSSYRNAPPASGSSYRSAPPTSGSSYRNAPPSSGSVSRSTPPSNGSSYRSTPQSSGSGGRSAGSTGSSARSSSSSSGGGKATGSSSKGSSGGSNGSSKSNGGNKRDR